MKIASIIFHIIAITLIVFNITKVNFETEFEGESVIALITILASICVILLLQILRFSKRIENYIKNKR
jgi:uncharacterized integral membrane protein